MIKLIFYFGTDPVLCLAVMTVEAAEVRPEFIFFGDIFMFARTKSVVFSISNVSDSSWMLMMVSSPRVGGLMASSAWVTLPRVGLRFEML